FTRPLCHDGRSSLAAVAVGSDLVAATECHEELSRPAIGQSEPELDGGIGPRDLAQPLLDSRLRLRRGESLSVSGGSRVKRLDASQTFDERGRVQECDAL